jgi:hypothetical protein
VQTWYGTVVAQLRAVRSLPGILLLASLGCQGAISDPVARGDNEGPPPIIEEEGLPFGISKSSTQLLPFDVRLNRVAAVVGLEPSDPLFDELRRNRIALGDYDHAAGVLPDSSWSAGRISLWTRLMRPICASPQMSSRYPNLPDDLDELIRVAYGREPEVNEVEDVGAILFEAELATPEAEYESVCLAVLGSAELQFK